MTYSQSQLTMRIDRMRIVDNVHLFYFFWIKCLFIYLLKIQKIITWMNGNEIEVDLIKLRMKNVNSIFMVEVLGENENKKWEWRVNWYL